MPVSTIRWGSDLKNVLRFRYGVRDVITDREPREGTEWSTTPGGVDDAWLTGLDYTLSAVAQFVPIGEDQWTDASPVSGPDSWTEFFQWARNKKAFSLYPDATLPSFGIDNCFLDEPLRGGWTSRTPSERDVRFKIRHPTVDLGAALRGLMFDYSPGAPLSDYPGATFTRATAANLRQRPDESVQPLAQNVLSGVLRDRHFEAGLPTTLVECSKTQLLANPENFSVWGIQAGTPTLTGGQVDPFGGTSAYLLIDDDAALSEGINQAAVFTNGVKGVAVFAKMNTAGISFRVEVRENPASINRLQVDIDWTAAGVPVLTSVGAGTYLGSEYWGFGWYRFLFQTTSLTVAGNTYTMNLRIGGDNNADVGSVYIFGANAFDTVYPGSYQGPSLATRNADALIFQHLYKPQPMFFYFKFVERGNTQGNGTIRLFRLGSGTSGTVRTFYITFNAIYGTRLNVDGNVTSATVNTVPAIGDVVELLVLLNADGSAQLFISVNGGAVQTNGAGAANPFPPGFAWDQNVFALGDLGDPLTAFNRIKYGPQVYQGVTRNTLPLARAA